MKKKILLVTVMALAIVTSMAAGTLATYTKTLEPLESTATAKQFYIDTAETMFADIKLAPTESTDWNFDVVNFKDGVATEVDMDLDIVVTVDGDIDGLKVSLFEGSEQVADSVVKNGEIHYNLDKAFDKNELQTRHFAVNVLWDNGAVSDAVDTANADALAATDISVNVTGTQDII